MTKKKQQLTKEQKDALLAFRLKGISVLVIVNAVIFIFAYPDIYMKHDFILGITHMLTVQMYWSRANFVKKKIGLVVDD